MREIVLDTETTGFEPETGDRIVEIGAVELYNHLPTKRHFHVYINPERPMPPEAEAVHGLSNEFLADKPRFAEVVGDFLAFIKGAHLVAHNAMFDLGFINAELKRCGKPPIFAERATDTLAIARTKFPGAKHTLDALCQRFDVDRSMRVHHGALLDAQLLAQVYVELTGGRQIGLGLVADTHAERAPSGGITITVREPRPARPHFAASEELERHRAFIAKLANPLWARFAEAG